ncbi:MAG: DEAD/DEAH box helicase [Methanobrevibacter sp.]|jgi:ATP-dependent Lhr-like helicase|nr:DEAD/DEAH box helicase [Candidatus Methanovirga basalitermitum]
MKIQWLLNRRLTHFLVNRLKWKSLNVIQEKAIPKILGGEDTLIISPTASGKTEAFLIPIFNEIINKRLEPTSVLYVAPLKALINDMFNRIEVWNNHFLLTATKWHGDVFKSKKDSFIKNPTDILLITPESLEVIFMNRSSEDKRNIFKNIEYMVVDEIHYFAESDRGTQLNSLLNRIDHYIDGNPVKIGLSATVGNPETVAKWLNNKSPPYIAKTTNHQNCKYKVIHDPNFNLSKHLRRYINKKLLIFVRSRSKAEEFFYTLKRDLKIKNIYLHHSSLSKDIKEDNEKNFKEKSSGFMISTNTLELGIDIGNIDIVVQVNPANNVSSFLQRIGRSGRRYMKPKTIVITDKWEEVFLTLSELSLIKEKEIEHINIHTKSKDIYFHQILSTVFEKRKAKDKDVFFSLKDAYVFSDISKNEFKNIINMMEKHEIIDLNNNYLSLGYNFEKKYGKKNFSDFFSVFCPIFEFVIKEGSKIIGTLDLSFALNLRKGDDFVLGGNYWRVFDIDYKRYKILVKSIKRIKNIPHWRNDGSPVNFLISRRVYDILTSFHDYENFLKTFDEGSLNIIKKGVDNSAICGFKKGVIHVEIDDKKVYIYTFGGDKLNNLVSSLFNIDYSIYGVNNSPFYSSFSIKEIFSFNDILNKLYSFEDLFNDNETLEMLDEITGKFYKNKFINFLPYKDQISLKMDLIFDKDNLIYLLKNNSIEPIYSVNFESWFKLKENDD